jgi:aspartyl-tRNA(Asn)/glutamyl-tRNA(Gln) amidotransferase subunit A
MNDRLSAVISTDEAGAMEAARRADADASSRGPLHGVTVTVKDIIDVAGTPTRNGACFPADVATADAEVVRRLKAAGAIVLGKVNLHEFAYGGTTQNPFFGSCRNPWDLDRIAGGSSGGSASAVAAGFCQLSIGSDTGGSGRLPAALTGIAGLRPTIGRVTRLGITPLSPFFDTVSPMAACVSDVAAAYGVMAGYDAGDAHCLNRPVQPVSPTGSRSMAGLRIGVPRGSFFCGSLSQGIAAAVEMALTVMESAGATLVDVTVPDIEDAVGYFEPLFHSDAAAVHAERLATSPELFGSDIRERLETLGGRVTGQTYAAALDWAMRWRRKLEGTLAGIDLILHAATPAVAPLVSECVSTTATTRKLASFCYPWSLAGVPSMSVPCGFAEHDMPCGIMLVAPWWHEATILEVGMTYQVLTDWHRRTPPDMTP